MLDDRIFWRNVNDDERHKYVRDVLNSINAEKPLRIKRWYGHISLQYGYAFELSIYLQEDTFHTKYLANVTLPIMPVGVLYHSGSNEAVFYGVAIEMMKPPKFYFPDNHLIEDEVILSGHLEYRKIRREEYFSTGMVRELITKWYNYVVESTREFNKQNSLNKFKRSI